MNERTVPTIRAIRDKQNRRLCPVNREVNQPRLAAANPDRARPIICHHIGAICREPSVKGVTEMVDSVYNRRLFEDAWLDK
jgi:hypothetical protein